MGRYEMRRSTTLSNYSGREFDTGICNRTRFPPRTFHVPKPSSDYGFCFRRPFGLFLALHRASTENLRRSSRRRIRGNSDRRVPSKRIPGPDEDVPDFKLGPGQCGKFFLFLLRFAAR